MKQEAAAEAKSNVTPQTFIKYLQSITRLKAACDEANSAYRTERKRAESDGIDLKALALFEKLRKLDNDDATGRLRRLSQYAKFMDLPWGAQLDMFSPETVITEEDAQIAAEFKAASDGYQRGIAGDSSEDNPYPGGTQEHVAWHKAHKEAVSKREASGATEKKPRGRPRKSGNPEDAPATPLH
jgi:ribosome modulation factor